jgi:hypothetical protein
LERTFVQPPVEDAEALLLIDHRLEHAPRPVQEDKYISAHQALVQFRRISAANPSKHLDIFTDRRYS